MVDSQGVQLGIMPIEEAITKAKEQGLDLIQITEKANPPVCKITDYGKFSYWQSKKEKEGKKKSGEMKGIRITFTMSEHDMQVKANLAKKFLEKGDKVKIEMRLKGRQKALKSFALDKIKKFIQQINELIPIKTERDIEAKPQGITTIITQNKQHETKN